MSSHRKPILLGIPYEGRGDFLRGASLAPQKIRWALESIELFSIYQNKNMPEYVDLGDIYVPPETDPEDAVKFLAEKLENILSGAERFLVLGGDHLITYPIIKAVHKRYPDLHVIHLDAHLDRRDIFEGQKFSHATVMKRIEEIIGREKIITLGYRSKADEEDISPRSKPFCVLEPLKELLPELEGLPIYLSLDLDVLDPSEFPGVTNPEPGGITFRELLEALKLLSGRLVAADIVEYNPLAFPGHFPAVTASILLRELMIILSEQ